MKQVTDAFGNQLDKGQLVVVKMGDQIVSGYITQLRQGGIQVAVNDKGNPQETPGMLVVTIEVPILFQQGARVGHVFRVVDPGVQNAVEKLAAEQGIS